jgi:nucleoid-associated protein YejK
MATEKEFYS